MSAPEVVLNILTWAVILILTRHFYQKQDLKPKIRKLIIIIFIGLFSFSIHLPYMDQQIKLAILPLGVWILYGIYSKKNEGMSWEKYRKFAWFGFSLNYFFLAMSLIIPIIHSGIYPKDELTTYISDISDTYLIKTHPSAGETTLDQKSLRNQIDNMKKNPIYSDQWYQETFETAEEHSKMDERFPYQLAGVKPRWGSGIHPLIYVERDGKGILISAANEQFYFRSEKSFLKGGK